MRNRIVSLIVVAGAATLAGCAHAPSPLDRIAVAYSTIKNADGDTKGTAELWQDALILDGRRGADWLALGDVLVRADRYREAAAAYQRAIQVDARLTEAGTRGVARAYARMGDDRQAVRWLEQALRLGARPAELWSDESFRPYRDAPRLQSELRRQVNRRGGDVTRDEGAST